MLNDANLYAWNALNGNVIILDGLGILNACLPSDDHAVQNVIMVCIRKLMTEEVSSCNVEASQRTVCSEVIVKESGNQELKGFHVSLGNAVFLGSFLVAADLHNINAVLNEIGIAHAVAGHVGTFLRIFPVTGLRNSHRQNTDLLDAACPLYAYETGDGNGNPFSVCLCGINVAFLVSLNDCGNLNLILCLLFTILGTLALLEVYGDGGTKELHVHVVFSHDVNGLLLVIVSDGCHEAFILHQTLLKGSATVVDLILRLIEDLTAVRLHQVTEVSLDLSGRDPAVTQGIHSWTTGIRVAVGVCHVCNDECYDLHTLTGTLILCVRERLVYKVHVK